MEKKEVINLLSKALSKLKYLQSKPYNKDHLDEISWIFSVFIKNYYKVRKEMTTDELAKTIKKRSISNAEKAALIDISQKLDNIKYQIKAPTKAQFSEILSTFTKFIKIKIKDEEEVKEEKKTGFFKIFGRSK